MRLARRLSQERMAELTGINLQTLRAWERLTNSVGDAALRAQYLDRAQASQAEREHHDRWLAAVSAGRVAQGGRRVSNRVAQ